MFVSGIGCGLVVSQGEDMAALAPELVFGIGFVIFLWGALAAGRMDRKG